MFVSQSDILYIPSAIAEMLPFVPVIRFVMHSYKILMHV